MILTLVILLHIRVQLSLELYLSFQLGYSFEQFLFFTQRFFLEFFVDLLLFLDFPQGTPHLISFLKQLLLISLLYVFKSTLIFLESHSQLFEPLLKQAVFFTLIDHFLDLLINVFIMLQMVIALLLMLRHLEYVILHDDYLLIKFF